MLKQAAPDAAVKATLLDYERTEMGSVARRARLRFCLLRSGRYLPEIQAFADANLEDVVQLVREFNDATHGSAGHYSIGQLRTIKQRVEDAIVFLYDIVRPPDQAVA